MSQSREPSGDSKTEKTDDVSKQYFRREVWEYISKNGLAAFPLPVFGRIPNFKGNDKAAARLIDLEEFKSAQSLEINPDKPLEHCRMLALENNKILYVPLPALQNTFLKHLMPPSDNGKHSLRRIVSRWGIENTGKTVDISDKIHIDILIVGSVVVSRQGHRIGKGKGFADLEFAILKEMNAINDDTVIVTCIHDCQVYDELPKELFQEHDMPVDYILTPTQTIKIEPRLSRPKGIIWSMLSQRRINLITVLQKLKDKHQSEGKNVELKEVDTDVETEGRRVSRYKRFTRRRTRSSSKASEGEAVIATKESPKRRKFYRRTRSNTKEASANGNSTENTENVPAKQPNRVRRPSRRFVDFSLMVSNIEKNVRIRDLKNALSERGIKPCDITWRGYRGFCYLHYAKPNAKRSEPSEPFAVDSVIEILQTLKISPESKNNLSVKVLEPITRIETTNVTAV